jgi:hypothetical protein
LLALHAQSRSYIAGETHFKNEIWIILEFVIRGLGISLRLLNFTNLMAALFGTLFTLIKG